MLVFLVACTNNPRVVEAFTDAMDATGLDALDLETDSAQLSVTTGTTNEIQLFVELQTTRTETTKDVDAVDSIHLELRDAGDGTARASVWFDHPVSRYEAHVTATLPPTLALRLADEDGDLEVVGVAALTLEDGGGDARIESVAGAVRIEDAGGDLDVRILGSDVEIDDGSGDILVREVQGKVVVRDGGGDIDVEDVTEVEIEEDGGGEVSLK